jgi:three-Cys-motif partner protein
MPIEVKPDSADGLPAMEAGEWVSDKHALLRQYLGISHAARRKFVNGRGGATYIELFAGPGRLFTKGTDQFFDGSPLVAHREAERTKTVFSEMHLGDEREDFCDALSKRLTTRSANSRVYPKRAEQAAREIRGVLNHYGFHFAFLDPFGFDGLPFTIVETLAGLNRMDVLIHVSAMELQRKLPDYVESKECTLDHFAPGWREVVRGLKPSDITARAKILEHWIGLIRKVGFREADGKPLIRGPNNQALYWLVLVAKHELATKFWDAINRPRQTSLFDTSS